jgi:hypothetical protein
MHANMICNRNIVGLLLVMVQRYGIWRKKAFQVEIDFLNGQQEYQVKTLFHTL